MGRDGRDILMTDWPAEDPELMSDYEFTLYLDRIERSRQHRAKDLDADLYLRHVQQVMTWGRGDG